MLLMRVTNDTDADGHLWTRTTSSHASTALRQCAVWGPTILGLFFLWRCDFFLDFYVLHASCIMDDILIVFCTLYVRRQREDLLASVFCAASDLSKNDNMLMSQKTARVRSSSSPSCVCMFEASDPSTLTGTIVVIGRQINTD